MDKRGKMEISKNVHMKIRKNGNKEKNGNKGKSEYEKMEHWKM